MVDIHYTLLYNLGVRADSPLPPTNAYMSDDLPANVITSVLALTFDAFTFFVTLIRTYQHVMEMRRLGQKGITELILRDGKQLTIKLSR